MTYAAQPENRTQPTEVYLTQMELTRRAIEPQEPKVPLAELPLTEDQAQFRSLGPRFSVPVSAGDMGRRCPWYCRVEAIRDKVSKPA